MFLFDVVVVLRPLLVKALKIINSASHVKKKVLNEKKNEKSSVESM